MRQIFAYLDPGSASMLLQALLGGFATIAVAAKLFGRRIFTLLRFRRPPAETTEPPSEEKGV